MNFPTLSPQLRERRTALPDEGRLRIVLDTDTFNEIDDQFAVAHALLSPQRLDVEAIYAAPYFNKRSNGPADGMEKSYAEILRLLERLNVQPDNFAFRGSPDYLTDLENPHRSVAATDLVERAMQIDASPDAAPLYVVAIGAITNVASAILMEPRIIERICVVWLGGQPLSAPSAREFNLRQDPVASRLIFDCGVPLTLLPCQGVSSHLLTTVPELEHYLAGQGPLCDFLVDTFKGYRDDHFAWAKEIWDIAGTAYLLNPEWTPTELVPSPILTDDLTWEKDDARHPIRIATRVHRNKIFRDLFEKLQGH